MKENIMKLTEDDNEKIASNYSDGDHPFTTHILEDENTEDAKDWLEKGDMVGIVSEVHGGIIGYVHEEHADDLTTILNLYAIDRMKGEKIKT